MMTKLITLEEGLNKLEAGIVKAKMILDGYPTNALFTTEEYMKFYDCVYFMCVQHSPYDHSAKLYERYKRALEDSIYSKVLPSLMDKNDASLLTELLHMWGKYKVMSKCLAGFFLYLDRHFANGRDADSLNDASVCCFRDLVCNAFYKKVQDAAISLINQDRGEKMIDRDLLKNVSTFFLEMGQGGNVFYYDKLEKVQWCLNQQNARAIQYMYQTTVEKLLQTVHWQLVGQITSQLIEKQKAESTNGSTTYQELLSQCASLSLGDGSSAS